MSKATKWVLGGLVATSLCCCGGIFGAYWSVIGKPSASYDAELERAAELGVPFRPEDMAREAVPEEDNAWPLMMDMVAEAEAIQAAGGGQSVTDFRKGFYEGTISGAAVSDFFRTYGDFYQAGLAASKRKYYLPEQDFSRPMEILYPEFAQVKSFAHLASVRAVQAAQSGNWDAAESHLMAARRLEVLLAEDRTLIAHLVAMAVDSILLDASVRAWSYAPDSARAQKMVETVAESSPDLVPYLALYGEAYMANRTAIMYVEDPESLGSWEEALGTEIPKAGPLAKPMAYQVLKFWNDNLPNVKEAGSDIDRFRELWGDASKEYEEWNGIQDMDTMLLAILLPVFDQAFNAYEHVGVKRTMVLAALRVQKEKLKELPDEPVFVDKWTGRPFELTWRGEGFTLTSAGKNGVLNGGNTDSAKGETDTVLQVAPRLGSLKGG